MSYPLALALTLAVELPIAGGWMRWRRGAGAVPSSWLVAATANLVSHVTAIGIVWPLLDDRVARVPVVVVLELVVWAFEAGVYARAAELSWRTAAAISAVANLASLAAGWWVSSR